jgi:hypothetical protein
VKLVAAIVVGLGAVGCVSTTVLKQAVAKPDGCELDVYTEAREIERKYDVLCLLEVNSVSVALAVDATRDGACKCGADAILVGSPGLGGVAYEASKPRYPVRAIRYKK